MICMEEVGLPFDGYTKNKSSHQLCRPPLTQLFESSRVPPMTPQLRSMLSQGRTPYFLRERPNAVLVSLDDLEPLRDREKGQRRSTWEA